MKAKTIPSTNDIGSTNFTPSIMNRPIMVAGSRTQFHEVIERPGHCIGRLLALQQTDGVKFVLPISLVEGIVFAFII